MPVLRFETAGLDLHFLYEREVDACSQWSVLVRPHADTAEGRVVDRDAVCYIQVFQTAGTGNRRVFHASAAAGNHARGQVEQAADTAAQWNFWIEIVGEIRVDRRS